MNEKGFTLIEILVVVAIIGILSAIALPQFSEYRVRAHNAKAMSDLRNTISAQEAYYMNHNAYATCTSDVDNTECQDEEVAGFVISTGSYIETYDSDGGSTLNIKACNTKGNTQYTYTSTTGILQTAVGICPF